MNHLHPN